MPAQPVALASAERLAEQLAGQFAAQASAETLAEHLAEYIAEHLAEHLPEYLGAQVFAANPAATLAEHLGGHKVIELAVGCMVACSAPPDRTLVVRKTAASVGRWSVVSFGFVPALRERLTRSRLVAGPHSVSTPASRCNQAAHMADCILPVTASANCCGNRAEQLSRTIRLKQKKRCTAKESKSC